ncbi:hypothetical protein JCM6882_005056 [Rhodosporidiobolus microsporus]
MARKKPVSGKARKAQLQAKRATKAANYTPTPFPADLAAALSSPVPSTSSPSSRQPTASRNDRIGQRFRTPEQRERDALHAGRLALESRFIRLPKEVAEHHRRQAATEVLPRPIPSELGVLREDDIAPVPTEEGELELSCPRRPKWNYSLSKKELEKNEEGVFKKWLEQTDRTLGRLRAPQASPEQLQDDVESGPSGSPSFFERNLQVWRQLWRTVERSDIILVLVDVRFPLLHYPPSLQSYLHTLKPPKPVILVLTKTDLVPAWQAQAWKAWFEEREGVHGAQVVLMESYRELERREETQGTQPRFIPATPPAARLSLVDALRAAHSALVTPPPVVSSDPAKLARWRPKVRREVDWELVEEEGGETGIYAGRGDETKREKVKGKRRAHEGEAVHAPEDERRVEPAEEGSSTATDEPPFLTVGLIGHPNVGKSSLLNALLSKKVVRASRTPGKTKTLQTIFWNQHLRLCDCPGLVCPSAAGLERQVLAGVLPIQNVEPVLRFVGQRIPLEKVLRLRHPDGDLHEHEDEFSLEAPDQRARWTTDDILAAYAEQQGFLTAKVGRPDIYRAGSSILRLLHSSSIPWAFRPSSGSSSVPEGRTEGLWLPNFAPQTAGARSRDDEFSEDEEDGHRGGRRSAPGTEEEDKEEEETEDSADEKAVQAVRGAFAALAVEEGESDSEEVSEEETSEDDE